MGFPELEENKAHMSILPNRGTGADSTTIGELLECEEMNSVELVDREFGETVDRRLETRFDEGLSAQIERIL